MVWIGRAGLQPRRNARKRRGFRVCVTTAILRQGTALQLAEKVGFLGGRSFSSDNKCLACNGLQPLRKRLKAFFRNLYHRWRSEGRRFKGLAPSVRNYERVMPIQKAAVRMPVRSSIRRRRCFRTATMTTPMAQSRKPNSGQNIAELSLPLAALAGSSSQKDANEVAAVSDAATAPASAKPFAHSGTTQSFFVSRQSIHVCATTNAATIRTNSATSPSPFAYSFVLFENIPAAEAARSAERKFRCWKRRAETVRGPLLPNYTLNARPLLPEAALLLRQTPLHLPAYIALLAIQVPLAPSA